MLLLLASGIGATILHIPVLNALWTTSYGVAILVKVGLLMAAMALGAVNLRRTTPRLVAARERSELGEAAARLLRRTVSGETVLLVAAVVHQDGYTLKALVTPNTPAAPNSFALQLTKGGQPVTGAGVTLTFEMLDMQMGNEEYQLSETQPGTYTHSAPALVMAGRWGLLYSVTPKRGHAFTALLVDHAGG